MGEGYAAIQSGVGLSVVGGGGCLMTHSAGSFTTQSIALKCDGFLTIQVHLIFKTGHGSFAMQ